MQDSKGKAGRPATIGSSHNLEQLEETLEKLQLEFEVEVDLYEQNQEKLRRMKSNLLAVDFAETFLKDDDDDDDENKKGSEALGGSPNGVKRVEVPIGTIPAPADRRTPETQNLPELEVINEIESDKENAQQSHPQQRSSPNAYPYKRMQGLWEKIQSLENLLESHQRGLREKIDCIKKTELEIRNISDFLNTPRSRKGVEEAEEEEESRNSFNTALQKSHELKLLLPQESESKLISTGAFRANKKDSTAQNPKDLELSQNLLSELESRGNLLSRAEIMSPPADNIHVEVANGGSDEDGFKITRKSWMICIGVNVVVVVATIAILIVNAALPASSS